MIVVAGAHYTHLMSVRFKRFVLLALMLMVPMQGLAATLHALSCVGHDGHAAAAAGHSHAGGDHSASHHHPDESSGGANDHSSHQCCHHFSAAPVHVTAAAPEDHSVFQSRVAPLDLSIVLERPQRPPRA